MDRHRSIAPTDVLAIRGLRKVYDSGQVALQNLDIEMAAGQSLVIVGGSGSGKSTLLRCIAGLERPDAGTIAIAGRTVFNHATDVFVPPERRGVSMMFQDYALWPHMSVRQNVAYPIRRSAGRAEIGQRVAKTLDAVGCLHLAEKRPSELSGGEQQRVALARALVGAPSLLLADEPFSNLDTVLRDRIRGDFLAMRQEVGFSLVHVTHDPKEAMMLGDVVLVLHHSQHEDLGPPLRVYERPRSVVAAQALGIVNQFAGRIVEVSDAQMKTEPTVQAKIETASGLLSGIGPAFLKVGDRAIGVARPAHVGITELGTCSPSGLNTLTGTLRFCTLLGDVTAYGAVLASGEEIRAENPGRKVIQPGRGVAVSVDPSCLWLIPEPLSPI